MLNDTKLRSLKARDKLYRLADSNGLCIEVTISGARHWRYRYRFAGKASMVGLGEYPGVSLAEARSERDRLRTLLKSGADPAAVKRAEKATFSERVGNTFSAIATEWSNKRTATLSPGSVKRERRMLEKDLGAYIGRMPIADITAPELLNALRKIENRGALESAHRARALAGQVFRYAIATGRAERDPSADLKGALTSPTKVHFASITEPTLVAPLLRAIWGYQGTPVVSAALKLAPLLFVRPGELRNASWADIDLEGGEWRFTASKTKTPHIVPLAKQAIEIFKEIEPLTGHGTYVFPSVRSVRRPMSENTINVALRSLGFDGETITGHGFRAMARTILDEVLGFRPELIEHQMAHAVRDPLGRAYNRTKHLGERKRMMQRWADYLAGLRAGDMRAQVR